KNNVSTPTHTFLSRWQASAAAERANYALFLAELCDFLEVPRPNPTTGDHHRDTYVFEHPVTFRHPNGTTSNGRIDLYKRGCFVLEAKQGSTAPEPTLFDLGPRAGSQRRGTALRDT